MGCQLVCRRMVLTILVLGGLFMSFPVQADVRSNTVISLDDLTGGEAVRFSAEETPRAALSGLASITRDQPLSKLEERLLQWPPPLQARIAEISAIPHLSLGSEGDGESIGHPRLYSDGLSGPILDSKLTLQDVPPAPRLLSPANGSALSTLIPVLEIDTGIPETPSSPRIELSLHPQFTGWARLTQGCGGRWGHFDMRFSPGWSFIPYTREDSGNLLPSTRYYWRARTAYGNACGVSSPEWGPWSEVYSFVTGSGGVILPGPQLLYPPNGDTVFDLRPMFSWQPVSGAESVAIWILGTTPEAGGRGVIYHNWPRTDYQPDWDLTPGGTYEWQVYYRNDYAWGGPSNTWTFSVSVASLAVSGRVLDITGSGIAGVIISDTVGHSVTTSDSGDYRLDHLVAGTYRIVPTRSGYVFCPPARTVAIPPNATEQDFRGGVSGSDPDPCPGRLFLPAIQKGQQLR